MTADSTAWATQVRLLAAQLVRRLNDELGDGSVQRVRVRGPAAAAGPARRPGEWRVRGGRGPARHLRLNCRRDGRPQDRHVVRSGPAGPALPADDTVAGFRRSSPGLLAQTAVG